MKTYISISIFLLFSVHCSSQDAIIRTNGERIDCEILSIDSTNVYFYLTNGNRNVKTSLSQDKIEKIYYNYKGEFDENTSTPDSILMRREGLTYKYYHKGIILSNIELSGILSLNQSAFQEFKSARSSIAMTYILGFSGGFLIGWPIGTAIAGKDPQWYMAAIGGGLILLSIPFSRDAKMKTHNAIDIYNGGLSKASYIKKEVLLGFTTNGIGVCLIF